MKTDKKHLVIAGIYLCFCISNFALAAALQGTPLSRLSPEAFILGIIGAFCVCAWLERIDSSLKTYASLLLAMLLAGFGSAAASQWLVNYCKCVDLDSLYYITPLLIGIGIPLLVPLGLKYLTGKVGEKTC